MIIFLFALWVLGRTRHWSRAFETRLTLLFVALTWMAWDARRPPMDLTSFSYVLLAVVELDESVNKIPGWSERTGRRLWDRLRHRSNS